MGNTNHPLRLAHSKPRGYTLTVLRWAVILLVIVVGTPLVLRWRTDYKYKGLIHTLENVPPRRVAVIFGAGIWPDGRLSDILIDRVYTAAQLYHQGKVEKLLMSGDNRFVHYNEPKHMRDYAVDLGVPDEDIVLDYAGRRTYDSCYRAGYIFGVTDTILVTQAYHLDRALFIANNLGLDAIGVVADRRTYIHLQRYWWRELLATTLAWWEVKVTHPEPILGDKLPIFPNPE